jgi:hypothetical protein
VQKKPSLLRHIDMVNLLSILQRPQATKPRSLFGPLK